MTVLATPIQLNEIEVLRVTRITYRISSWLSLTRSTRPTEALRKQHRMFSRPIMKHVSALCLAFLVALILIPPLHAQVKEIGEVNVTPAPKIKRLFDALGGIPAKKGSAPSSFPMAASARAGPM
jgi:hypothetical protein